MKSVHLAVFALVVASGVAAEAAHCRAKRYQPPQQTVAALLAKHQPSGVLVFTSESCIWCRQMYGPGLKLQQEGKRIFKVDWNAEPAMIRHYQPQALPTTVLVIDGKEVTRLEGLQSEQTLRHLLSLIPAKKKAI